MKVGKRLIILLAVAVIILGIVIAAPAWISKQAGLTADTEVCMTEAGSESGTEADSGAMAEVVSEHMADGNTEAVTVTEAMDAGHGSYAAAQVQTLCHPDGTQKVTGGSTAAGATYATGANGGTTLNDGTSEGKANLALALIVKDVLLEKGYDVLMIREDEDCSLDNIARTVYANNNADCHLALHYDSTQPDKGFFYIGVPNVSSYRNMEPVASHWEEHEALGTALVSGARNAGVKVYSNGCMALDLTQTSYSTVPSVDVEVGDRSSDHSEGTLHLLAEGIAGGLDIYFGLDGQD